VSISSLDLNLLVVLHTVLAERSVARAAKRLHVTASAVSNSLARLRVALDDPLVTRKGRGIVPTPRALELAPVLARTLRELEGAISAGPFDAARSTQMFTLAVAEAGQIAWVPRITELLRRQMPGARLRVVGIDSMVTLGDLSSSEVDLHIGVQAEGPGMLAELLVKERTTLVGRKSHPALTGRLSRRGLGALKHVMVQLVPSRTLRDRASVAYERVGIEREVVLAVPTFTAAAAVAASTDLVATLPSSFVASHGSRLGLSPLKGPVPAHDVSISLCWHERTHADLAMVAFRTLVRRAVASRRPAQATSGR
jgi:DNA-binding transcriptional LysR family regulator